MNTSSSSLRFSLRLLSTPKRQFSIVFNPNTSIPFGFYRSNSNQNNIDDHYHHYCQVFRSYSYHERLEKIHHLSRMESLFQQFKQRQEYVNSTTVSTSISPIISKVS
jgi:hypothetical protein